MVKCLPEFEYFTVFLKNKNISFKIKRSKVTDYAALRVHLVTYCSQCNQTASPLCSNTKKSVSMARK